MLPSGTSSTNATRRNHTTGTSTVATSTNTPQSAQAASRMPENNSEARLAQIYDDQDHKRCVEANHRALLVETLEHLRSQTKVLQSDDWMHAPSPSYQGYPFPHDSDFPSARPRS